MEVMSQPPRASTETVTSTKPETASSQLPGRERQARLGSRTR